MRIFFYSFFYLCSILSLKAQITLIPNAAPTAGMTTVDNYSFGMCGTNYGTGSDTEEIYTYTATADVPCASINLNPATQYTGVFVFEDALPTADTDPCLASAYENVFGSSNPVTANFAMVSGKTYYFVVTTDFEGDVSFDIDLDIPTIPTPYVAMSNASVTVSDGTPLNFYDSGGPTCEYMLNENYTLTVCPDAAGTADGKLVQLEFTAFERDGNCTTSSEITFYKGTSATAGQEIFSGEYENVVFDQDVRIFTSIVAGGCMTIVWTNGTDTNCEGPGWEGNFQLVDNPCSTPISDACATAPLLEFGSTLESNTECFTGGSGACGLGSNNNGWFKFIADGTSANIDYQITGGNACYASEPGQTSIDETSEFAGIQLLLYEGCGAAQQICGTVDLATGGINVENGMMASGTWSLSSLTDGQEYYVQFDSYGSDLCNFTVTGAAGTALPLELSSFTAKENGESNLLEWVTLSEENTDVYIVERAVQGMRFVEIAKLDAGGSSTETLSYQYIDESPASTSHYRIKAVDLDGSIFSSKVETVTRRNKTLAILSTTPNPSRGSLFIDIDVQSPRTAVLSIVNVAGQRVLELDVNLERGVQQIPVDVSSLAQGMYIIHLSNGINRASYKFIRS